MYEAVIERARRANPDPETDAGYYGRLLLSPQMAAQLSELGRIVRRAGARVGSYSHVDREWVDQVMCADWNTNIVQGVHLPDAIAAGVRPEAIKALRAGDEDSLTDDERRLTRFIRQVLEGEMTDESWSEMEGRLGERGVVEYTIFVLFLQLTIRLMQAMGLPDPPDSEIDRMLEEFMDGTKSPPEYQPVR